MSEFSKIHALTSKHKNRLIGIIIFSIIVSGSIIYSNFDLSFLSILCHALASYVLITIISFISILELQRKYYESTEDFVNDVSKFDESRNSIEENIEEINNTTPFKIDILDRPLKPIAHFKNEPIYEWLIVRINNNPVKIQYDGILNLREGQVINLEPDEILFSPGILYKKF